jgi:hypothetical protein
LNYIIDLTLHIGQSRSHPYSISNHSLKTL